jgi:recombination protein RecT
MTDTTAAIQKKQPTALDHMMQKVLERKETITSLLPRHVDVDNYLAEIRYALGKNTDLLKCTPHSILGCIAQAAQLGLSPSGRLGSAYLIPFKTECTLVVGYRGLIDLAVRGGEVVSIRANVVREKDTFVWDEGSEGKIVHRPYLPTKDMEQNAGDVVAAYAVAQMRGGYTTFSVMTLRELNAIKGRSRGANSGRSPWTTDEAEMQKKTVTRRLIKYLPVSPEKAKDLARALEAEDEDASAYAAEEARAAGPVRGMAGLKNRLSPKEEAVEDAAFTEAEEEYVSEEPPDDVVLPGRGA